MHKILLILAHAAPAVGPRYQAAVGPTVKVVPFVAPSAVLSSGYVAFAARLRARGARAQAPILDALLTFLGIAEEDRELPIIMGGYSAGYALIRELCRAPEDRQRIAGWLLLDGGHAPLERDGTADDRSVGWLAELVRDAAEGRTVLAYGMSDVQPGTYASTTQTIREAMRLAGVAPPAVRTPCSGCRVGQSKVVLARRGLLVEAHDHRMDPVQEHMDVLREWGAGLAARAVEMVRGLDVAVSDDGRGMVAHGDPDAGGVVGGSRALREDAPRGGVARGGDDARADAPLGIGERALAVALRELAAGAREEPPGSNGGPAVRRYHAGAVRGGKLLRITSGPWCASFVGHCDAVARSEALQERQARDGGSAGLEPHAWAEPPCLWRAAVWELVRDASPPAGERAEDGHAWREAAEYSPLPGDLAVFKRAGGDPRIPGQEGHVGRVETAPDAEGRYTTIDGNAGDRVARVERNLSDTDLIGFVVYPRAPAPPSYHVETRDLAAGAAAVGLDRTAREAGE